MSGDARRIDRIGVVVPAHDEERRLPRCLDALAAAIDAVDVPVRLVVVLDACSDGTARAAAGVPTLRVQAHSVGAARRAGFRHLLREIGTSGAWLATTDADSIVPPGWLAAQLGHARRGVDAVAGLVRVNGWRGHPAGTAGRFRALHPLVPGHRHVHGANLGMTAEAYLAAGGFPSLALHEDVALVTALKRTGHTVLHAADLPVVTSGRLRGRVVGGFADFLVRLGMVGSLVTPAGDPAR